MELCRSRRQDSHLEGGAERAGLGGQDPAPGCRWWEGNVGAVVRLSDLGIVTQLGSCSPGASLPPGPLATPPPENVR